MKKLIRFLPVLAALFFFVDVKPVYAEPVTLLIIGGSIAALAADLGVSIATATIIASVITAVITTAIGVGVSYLGQALFGPKAPRPEDRQILFRDGNHSRFRSYGRVKVGGVIAYLNTVSSHLYRVIIMGQGELDAIEEHWIGDKLVTLNGTGNVLTDPFVGYVNIQTRIGTSSQTAYADLIAADPTRWTSAHQGNGMPHVFMDLMPIGTNFFSTVFPTGEPNYNQVQRGAKIFDPRDVTQSAANSATWKWSQNAALCIMDFITHPDGMKLPRAYTQVSIDKWIQAANDCDDAIALKAGGTTNRWRLSAIYDFAERPVDVLNRMVISCDGKLFHTQEGGLALSVGKWSVPTVTIGDDALNDYDVTRGNGILNAPNVIKATYTSPPHNYQTTEADDLRDDADVTLRGEVSTQLDLQCCPNHSQARRLMKIVAARANPNWQGTLTCNLLGLTILGERFITLNLAEMGINETVEILGDSELILGNDMILQGVRFQFGSLSAAAYSWDAATEEGVAAAIPPPIITAQTVPNLTGFSASVVQRVIASGATVAVAIYTWTPDANISLTTEVQQKLTSGSATTWSSLNVVPGQSTTESGILIDGESYDARARFVSFSGAKGAWCTVVTFTAVADITAPPAVTAVTGAGGLGVATINWTSPNNVHYIKARIYRNSVNVFSSSTFVKNVFGPSNTAQSTTDTGLVAATYYYFVTASNGSNIESSSVATGAVVVT